MTYADGYGVILVDDRNNAHRQQFFEGVNSIEITRSLRANACVSGTGIGEEEKTTIHPKYHLSSKALGQWVARAGRIDYPKVL